MNDNAKCNGVGCSIREHCLRFTRPAVDEQQWVYEEWVIRHYEGRPSTFRCTNHQPLPVEPHGGAQEEGDGA